MENFQNNPLSNIELPDFETVQLTPVSTKYLKVVMFNTAIFSFFLLIASGVGYYFLLEYVDLYSWAYFGGILLFLFFNFLYQYFAFFQRKYAFRERDVIYQSGLLHRSIEIFPFNRIQHSALEDGWFSRILGLKSVSVFTAGAGSDLTINGLPKEIAESFNQLIINKIKNEELISEENTENFNVKPQDELSDGE